MNLPDDPRAASRLFVLIGRAGCLWIVVASFFATLAPAVPARASQVRIPLTIDYIALREALKHKLYTAPGRRAPLWNGRKS
jgi:hypothetical protein